MAEVQGGGRAGQGIMARVHPTATARKQGSWGQPQPWGVRHLCVMGPAEGQGGRQPDGLGVRIRPSEGSCAEPQPSDGHTGPGSISGFFPTEMDSLSREFPDGPAYR